MPRFSLALPLSLVLLPLAASADMYRCQKDGAILFSDKPCASDAQEYKPKPIQVVPATNAPDLATQ